MSTQPKALEVADALWNGKTTAANVMHAVAELRRLHALNVQMLDALKKAQGQAIKYPWASGSFLNIIEEAIAAAQEQS